MEESASKGDVVASKPVYKWQLNAWPVGQRWITENGKTRQNLVFRGDYTTPGAAHRSAIQVHRLHPAAQIEVVKFVLQGGMCRRDDPPGGYDLSDQG